MSGILIVMSITSRRMVRHPRPTRNKYLQPFASDSIWNRPIGTGASYITLAGLATSKGTTWRAPHQGYSVDESWISLVPNSPVRKLIERNYWWPYPQDKVPTDSGARVLVPDNFIVPIPPPGNTPNNMSAMLTPDPSGNYAQEFQYICRPDPGTDVTFHEALRGVWNLRGDGLSDGFGSHGGSGLNCLGGTIRAGELLGPAPISHALSVTINTQKWACGNGGGIVNGYRWPARVADNNALATDGYGKNVYHNPTTNTDVPLTNPGAPLDGLGMGTLLALPASLSIASLGLETPEAVKIAVALQEYGAYVVDTSGDTGAWDVWLWNLDSVANRTDFPQLGNSCPGTTPGMGTALVRDLNKVIVSLAIITNNIAGGTCAGGGTPIGQLAPPLR